MLNLIKLELKRVSLKSHFIGLLAANIVIALLSAFTSSLLNAGGGVAVTGLPPAQLDTLTLATMLPFFGFPFALSSAAQRRIVAAWFLYFFPLEAI